MQHLDQGIHLGAPFLAGDGEEQCTESGRAGELRLCYAGVQDG